MLVPISGQRYLWRDIYFDCRLFLVLIGIWTGDLWIFSLTLYHCATGGVGTGGVGTHLWLLQVFNSGVRGFYGRIFIWTVDYFWSWLVFCTGNLWIFSLTLYHSATRGVGTRGVGIHLWLLQVFNSGIRGICGRIFIWTVDHFCPDWYLNCHRAPGALLFDRDQRSHWNNHYNCSFVRITALGIYCTDFLSQMILQVKYPMQFMVYENTYQQ